MVSGDRQGSNGRQRKRRNEEHRHVDATQAQAPLPLLAAALRSRRTVYPQQQQKMAKEPQMNLAWLLSYVHAKSAKRQPAARKQARTPATHHDGRCGDEAVPPFCCSPRPTPAFSTPVLLAFHEGRRPTHQKASRTGSPNCMSLCSGMPLAWALSLKTSLGT